ncbi:hypothetical protein BOO71_0000505 [Deinococcus marmoris]|uniref:site-specific DNA-methyltransferase (adenine-specific) n=2 Tax=Deinococcus marmoris TaxID=249408 RepID=A0A1U7P4S1_9DEIO|nr:hypothetical protein BOO71_0000505 [Deinococcus marmoris]
MARAYQRQSAEADREKGFIGDPLRLPFFRILEEVRRVRVSEAYRRLVQAGAAALTLSQQEETYLDAVRGLDEHDLGVIVRAFHQLITDMDDRPYTDLLGPVYMEIGHRLDRAAGAEFYTPRSICRLMAQMTLSADLTPGEVLHCNEPACGTGGMILAFTEVLIERGGHPLNVCWTAQDLSARSCWATFLNLTLWGLPAQVVCGNTLALENRWTWRNRFWDLAMPYHNLNAPLPEEDAQFARVVDAMRGFLNSPPPTHPQPEFGPLFGGPL